VIHVYTTCIIVIGKEAEIKNAFLDLRDLSVKKGAKYQGFWWTVGGEEPEASWLFSWHSLNNYRKGIEEIRKESRYPIEELASSVISLNDKILLPEP
jgi:hypothetical protein